MWVVVVVCAGRPVGWLVRVTRMRAGCPLVVIRRVAPRSSQVQGAG